MALTIFNPDVGMRLIVAELIIVQMTICRVLCEQLLYPYCMQQVQGHKPADSAAGEALCQCSTHLKQIVGRYSIINFHNHHQWAEDNPHGELQSRHHQQFSIYVQVSTAGDCLVGPHVLPCKLTGNHYGGLFLTGLPYLLEYVTIVVRELTWFMHYVAPNFSHDLRDINSWWMGTE